MEPKWVPKWSQNQAPERGASGRASGSDLGGFWRPKKLPRGSPEGPQSVPGEPQERPRRPKGSPRRSKMSPRRVQMTPRRGKMSPRRARVSSGRSREASGSDLGRISKAFPSSISCTETVSTVCVINYKINFSWFNHTLS